MPADIDGLDVTENLTSTEIPALGAHEHIALLRMADASQDMKAEIAAYTSFVPADEEDGPEPEELDGQSPPSVRMDTPKYLRARFEYMCRGWYLEKPSGEEIPFTRANRDKIFRLFGPYLITAMNARAGGIARTPSGKDADGNPLTFRDGGPVRDPEHLAGSVDAGSVRPGAARKNREGAALHVS